MIAEIQVGEPVCYQCLAVFPLFRPSDSDIKYQLSDEAIGAGTVTIEEVDQEGTVPELMVENKGDCRVLFLEGEELVGAKQNRVLNTSVLIGAKKRVKIPVSCVERGRWHHHSRGFQPSGFMSSVNMRRILSGSVGRSLAAQRGHHSDQGEVWREVARAQDSLGTVSGTHALTDTFRDYQDRIAEFRERLPYREGASGVAVALGGRVVALDLFDKPSTCCKIWDRLLSGFVLDALEAGRAEKPADVRDVQNLLEMVDTAAWQPFETVGDGQEYRVETRQGTHACELTLHGTVVHARVFVGE